MRPAFALLLVLTAPLLWANDEEVSRERLEALKEQIGSVTDWLEDAREDEDQHQARLREAEQSISRINQRLGKLESRAAELDEKLAQLKEENRRLEARAAEGRETLSNLIRSAWMQGDHATLRLLLSETDPQNIARLMTWHEYIGDNAREKLEALAETRRALEQNRQDTRQARTELEDTRDSARQRRDELAQRRQDREEALTALRAEINERESTLSELQDDRDRLSELLKEMEREISSLEPPEDARPFSKLRAKLPWPVRGNVSRQFWETVGNSDMRTNGIRIRTEEQAPVTAVHYGRVVFANWLRGFGLMIIIDHGDGFMSLYGNNDSLNYSAGEWVRAGDTIAQAGSSGGRSKPGLYFEIRRDGQPENPESWLE